MIGHKLERIEHRSVAHRSARPQGSPSSRSAAARSPTSTSTVQPGEIVGVAGITGSGREMVAPFITGQTPSDAGNVVVCGTPIPELRPARGDRGRAGIRAGRPGEPGIIPLESVTNNLTLADVERNWRGGRLRHDEERAECRRLDRPPPDQDRRHRDPDRCAERRQPAEGAVRSHAPADAAQSSSSTSRPAASTSRPRNRSSRLIDEAAGSGAAVLVVSTDTDELVQVAHRIVIMVGGTIVAELSGAEMTTENVERRPTPVHESDHIMTMTTTPPTSDSDSSPATARTRRSRHDDLVGPSNRPRPVQRPLPPRRPSSSSSG